MSPVKKEAKFESRVRFLLKVKFSCDSLREDLLRKTDILRVQHDSQTWIIQACLIYKRMRVIGYVITIFGFLLYDNELSCPRCSLSDTTRRREEETGQSQNR